MPSVRDIELRPSEVGYGGINNPRFEAAGGMESLKEGEAYPIDLDKRWDLRPWT